MEVINSLFTEKKSTQNPENLQKENLAKLKSSVSAEKEKQNAWTY